MGAKTRDGAGVGDKGAGGGREGQVVIFPLLSGAHSEGRGVGLTTVGMITVGVTGTGLAGAAGVMV